MFPMQGTGQAGLTAGRETDMELVYGLALPFLGTALGAACVFFMRKTLRDSVQRALTGFAAGVMVAASVWSLLIPAIEQSAALGRWAFFPAFAGFWIGVAFLLLLDHVIPHLHQKSARAEGPHSNLERTTMMVLAVTLHNIPEGMAVGWYTRAIWPAMHRSPRPVPWRCRWALPSKTSRRGRSFLFRCGRRE